MDDTMDDTMDAIVVGGSWAGLAAALQLVRARRHVLIVDAALPRNRFAHASHVFLGQDGRAPAGILQTARAQVLRYPTARHVQDEATHARAHGDCFEVTLASGTRAVARRLVLATGVSDELPPIPGLAERWGTTVLHCPYCHGYEVADGRLGVLGLTEHGVRVARLLRDWSDRVTLFTGGGLVLDDAQRALLAARGVALDEREVESLEGEAPSLTGVRLRGGAVVPLDALFVPPRVRMTSPLAAQLGCEFDEGPLGPVIRTDAATKETTVRGVYAAGDAARAAHTVSWAVADGVTAGVSAHQSLALA